MTINTANQPEQQSASDANRDLINGTPGAQPVGTGVGAVIQLAAATRAGGLAGKSVEEKMDPKVEEASWKTHFSKKTTWNTKLIISPINPITAP